MEKVYIFLLKNKLYLVLKERNSLLYEIIVYIKVYFTFWCKNLGAHASILV